MRRDAADILPETEKSITPEEIRMVSRGKGKTACGLRSKYVKSNYFFETIR